MAWYRTELDTSWSPARAFAYMAEFSNAAEWDPGVAEARRLDDGPVGQGSGFALWIPIAGRRVRFDYRIVAYQPPSRVTVAATTRTLRSEDTIDVVPLGSGATVRYIARLQGPRLLDPLLSLAFRRIGDRASAGLRSVLPLP